MKEANLGVEKNKYLVLMKIKDFFFDKNTYELIEFTVLGDIHYHLDNLKKQCSSKNTSSDVANHMLMFKVRGLYSDIEYHCAQFPTKVVTADSLNSIFSNFRILMGCLLSSSYIAFGREVRFYLFFIQFLVYVLKNKWAQIRNIRQGEKVR